MTDVIDVLVGALARRSAAAPALAYGIGVLTSAGPCLAPRVASLAGMAARVPREKRWQLHLCFVGGLALSYALLAGSIALLARMTAASPIAYAMLAALLLWFGVRSVVRNPDTCEDHGHQSAITSGSAFLTGAGYAFVVSPCCTPVVAAIAGAAGTLTSPEFAAAVAVMFGLGHASAVLLGSLAVSRLWRTSFAIARRPEFSIVSGAVMIALGGYYALLA